MSNVWYTASPMEISLGKEIANSIYGENDSIGEVADALLHLSLVDIAVDALKTPFAYSDNEVSNSVIAQIAYSLSDLYGLNDGNGVVLTPPVLAIDMVKMSIAEWLKNNALISNDQIIRFLWYGESTLGDDLLRKLSLLKWLDPCVGGGVFPLAIICVYYELGLGIPQIFGNDINPLYVAATKKRISLSTGVPVERLETNIVEMDSLDPQRHVFSLFSLLNEELEYDCVIGNPPYVSSSHIAPEQKACYMRRFPEMGKTGTDLYAYFICAGIRALKKGGILTFVTPGQFQISNYGKGIRRVICENGGLCSIADFNELPVFENIGVHTTVYSLIKGFRPGSFIRYEYEQLPDDNPLLLMYERNSMLPQENITEAGWSFSSEYAFQILNHIESAGIGLRYAIDDVYSGIKSGCKQAFFLTESDISDFDEYDMRFCKPMLLPKEIRRWSSPWKRRYFAVIPKGEQLQETSKLFLRMQSFKQELSSRTDVVGHETWYGLRECSYYDLFSAPKIVYPDIATESRFCMDTSGFFLPDGAFFIPKEDYYLLGLLNSCIARYYFKEKCARIGNPQKGGRIRFKKVYVEDFPVVERVHCPELAAEVETLAVKATREGALSAQEMAYLDALALAIYDVPKEWHSIVMEA